MGTNYFHHSHHYFQTTQTTLILDLKSHARNDLLEGKEVGSECMATGRYMLSVYIRSQNLSSSRQLWDYFV